MGKVEKKCPRILPTFHIHAETVNQMKTREATDFLSISTYPKTVLLAKKKKTAEGASKISFMLRCKVLLHLYTSTISLLGYIFNVTQTDFK